MVVAGDRRTRQEIYVLKDGMGWAWYGWYIRVEVTSPLFFCIRGKETVFVIPAEAVSRVEKKAHCRRMCLLVEEMAGEGGMMAGLQELVREF